MEGRRTADATEEAGASVAGMDKDECSRLKSLDVSLHFSSLAEPGGIID